MKVEHPSLHSSAPNFAVYSGHKLGDVRPQDHDLIVAFQDSLSRKSPKTRATYREAVEMLAGFTAGCGMPLLENLEREPLESFFNSLHARGNSPATIRNRQASVRVFYNWAVDFDLRKTHPMERTKTKLEPLPDKVMAHYEPGEIAAVLAAAKGNDALALRDRACILMLYDTGLRAAELCGLQVGDVDRETRTALVRRGKGGKQRRVRYGAATAAALFKYLTKRPGYGPTSPLFVQERKHSGEAMTFNGLRTFLERRFRAAGVAFHGVHGFRRSMAISYLDAGGDVLNLKELAGWNTLQMAYKYVKASAQERALREYESPADRMVQKERSR